MRNFDFHPDESFVRSFGVPSSGIFLNHSDLCVYQIKEINDEYILRHIAFKNEWFKLNITYDSFGQLIDAGQDEDGFLFAINCDISTPMTEIGSDIASVDLFLDVLVDSNGNFKVVDQDGFYFAFTHGLISIHEVNNAEKALEKFISWIESGYLFSFLSSIPTDTVNSAPVPLPFKRVDITQFPALAPEKRGTWRN